MMNASQFSETVEREGLARRAARRPGFTLIELLVVMTIILIVSAVALPTVLPALSHRQVSEGARILQAALVGARDSAIKNNAASGIRLLPDPAFSGIQPLLFADGTKNPSPLAGLLDPSLPLACNRIIPLAPAPDYSEGLLSILLPGNLNFSGGTTPYLNYPVANQNGTTGIYPYAGGVLTVFEQVVATNSPYLPNAPTSWFWNIRIGDKIQINQAGPFYTVVGPLAVTAANGNPELFVNIGPPGTGSPMVDAYTIPGNPTAKPPIPPVTVTTNPEFLFLTNGQDDNKNGWVDEGWDGVNNNGNVDINGNPLIDELFEWEPESWHGAIVSELNASPNGRISSQQYVIQRRPAPTINAREVLLPTNVVVDLSTWGYLSSTNPSLERSRLPVNPFTGYVDIMVNPRSDVVLSTLYSTPSAAGLGSSFLHFWVAERGDIYAPGPNNVTRQFPTLFASAAGDRPRRV